MLSNRRQARDFFKRANKKQFDEAIINANLTDEQEDILRKCVGKNKSRIEVAMILHRSESQIRRILAQAYDKVSALCSFV